MQKTYDATPKIQLFYYTYQKKTKKNQNKLIKTAINQKTKKVRKVRSSVSFFWFFWFIAVLISFFWFYFGFCWFFIRRINKNICFHQFL